ncbi:MAG: SRPBCC domain-containing protein [Bacteroidota bacterium]
MTKANAKIETSLQLKRTFAAPRERLFRAWTEPAALKKWFAPTDEYSMPIAQVDLRIGGNYRFGMKPPNTDVPHVAFGTFREIRVPEKLVFTWSWENPDSNIGETLVTVEFRDLGGSTEIILTHDLFPDEKSRDDHNKGWTGCLGRLAKLVST